MMVDDDDPQPLACLSTMSPRRRSAASIAGPGVAAATPQMPYSAAVAHRDSELVVPPPPTIQKFNSTSSLYIKDTLAMPDLDELAWW